jgi:hypothetical protein
VVARRIDLHRRDLQERREMTFAKGAALKDPSGLFNSSLDGNTRRAIDFHEGEKIVEEALKTLVRAAVTLNKVHSRKLIHGRATSVNARGIPHGSPASRTQSNDKEQRTFNPRVRSIYSRRSPLLSN